MVFSGGVKHRSPPMSDVTGVEKNSDSLTIVSDIMHLKIATIVVELKLLFSWCSCRVTVTRRMSLVEQELLNRPYHLSLPPVFSEGRFAQSSVFSVVFCSLLL